MDIFDILLLFVCILGKLPTWLRSDILNYLAIARWAVPALRHPVAPVQWSFNFFVSLVRNVSQTSHFYTHRACFARVLCAVSHVRRTDRTLNGNRPMNAPSTCEDFVNVFEYKTWTTVHCFKKLLYFWTWVYFLHRSLVREGTLLTGGVLICVRLCGVCSKTLLTSSTPTPFWWSRLPGRAPSAGSTTTWSSWPVKCRATLWWTKACSRSPRPSPRELRASLSSPSRSIR